MRVPIVYEDDVLVVVDKPAGLLTMANEKERDKTAYSLLRARANAKRPREKIFIVHRLDREASGLIVFAKTADAKEFLQSQFKDHTAGRTYTAVVEGQVAPDAFTIRSFLDENRAYRVYSTSKNGAGKIAITHVKVLKKTNKTSIVQIRLETGRKHQIRVHLAERGHPVVGDKFYGTGKTKSNRLALHGARLEFRHPVTGKRLTFDSPAPTEWR